MAKMPKAKVGDRVRLKRQHLGQREGVVVEVVGRDLFMIATAVVKRLAVVPADFVRLKD